MIPPRRRRRRDAFTPGSEIEAQPDGPGFGGAWFEARVLRSRPDRCHLTVVYDALADDASPSVPLQETLSFARARPRPPRAAAGPYGAGDHVDALYNDGWWRGVVARVNAEHGEEGKYAVRFPEFREEMEFGAAELRPHVEWKECRWVSPEPEQKLTKPAKLDEEATDDHRHSSAGTSFHHKCKVPHIERSLTDGNDETLCGPHIDGTNSVIKVSERSTLESKLVSPISGKNPRKETIEDNTRLIDCLLRTKSSSRVKTGFNVTLPKIETKSTFHLKTYLVDKFPCSTSSFKNPNTATEPHTTTSLQKVHEAPQLTPGEFIPKSLVLHISHIIVEPTSGGKDPTPEADEVPPPTPAEFIRESLVPQTPHITVETPNRGDELTPGTEINDKKRKAPVTQEHPQANISHDNGVRKVPVTEDQPQGKIPHDGRARKFTEGRKRRRKGVPQKVRIIDTKASSEGNDRHTPDAVDLSTIVHYFSISRCDAERSHGWSPSTVNHEGYSVGDINEPSTEDHSTCRTDAENRGGTCIKSSGNLIAGTSNLHSQNNEAESEVQTESSVEGHATCQTDVETHGGTCIKSSGNMIVGTSNLYYQSNEAESEAQNEPSTEGHSICQTAGDQQDRLINDPSTEGHSICQTYAESQGGTCIKSSGNMRLHSQNTEAGSVEQNKPSSASHFIYQKDAEAQGGTCIKSSANMMAGASNLFTQNNEVRSEARKETLLSISEIQVAGAPTPDESPTKMSTLLFEKNSAMWEAIESMEVISKMRHQPHFQPLKQYSEALREGMAIGLMVTYSNLMNSIVSLKIDDSCGKFNENITTMIHLEEHGFDVQHARARLEELMRIKNDHGQLVEKSSALGVLMLEKEKEKDELTGNIKEIDQVIVDLKRTLAFLGDKKASILKQQEENDSHIVKLKMDVRIVEEVLQSAERDFEAIIGSAW